MEEYVNELIKLCKNALKTDDIPVGAIVVYNSKIIGKGFNTREAEHNVMGHAEINAIKDASAKLNNWNLENCDMYVTLKPCSMCAEIIKQSRISNVYYLIDKSSKKREYEKTNFVKKEIKNTEEEYLIILGDFFKKLREK